MANVVAKDVGVEDDRGVLSARLTGYNESLSGMRRWAARTASVSNGIDVLEEDRFAELSALARSRRSTLRVGLLTNQTGLDHEGRRTIDVLAEGARASGSAFQVTTIFSPEHGISGSLDVEGITNSEGTRLRAFLL